MAPLPEYPDDLWQGALPAPRGGPVENLGPLGKDLHSVLKVVKGSRGPGRSGPRIFRTPDVVKTWGTEATKSLRDAWSKASPARRSALKRSLERFNATLQESTGSVPAVLPSFQNMHDFLTAPHAPPLLTSPHPSANVFNDQELLQRAVHAGLPFDPAHPDRVRAEHALARTPRARLGLRAAARYGLDKREWERRAHGLYQ
ncbi:hypothetical protein JCM9279_000619 [Rhodotorula babjevae]